MDLSLTVDESRPHYAVVTLCGDIDVATAPVLREKLLELVQRGQRQVVVDLEKVTFLDSTGIGVFVGALKRLRSSGGDLRMVCSQPRLLTVFEITGLTTVFKISDTLEVAVSDLR